VRPSLKNWLADYTFTLGQDKHTAMDRGIYLFQSGNGKRLASQDRQKLAYILKAFDESFPVTINKDVKRIIFRAATETSEPSSPNVKAQIIPNQAQNPNFQNSQSADNLHSTMRFSSPQKLPYEKQKAQPYVIRPIFSEKEEPKDKPLPKNVVNLKDI